MSMHVTTEPISVKPHRATDCSSEFCVLVGREGNIIEISSDVPEITQVIRLTVEDFRQAMIVIKMARPEEINPFRGTHATLDIVAVGEGHWYLVGPDGDIVKFSREELLAFYNGVRAGDFDSSLQLDTYFLSTSA